MSVVSATSGVPITILNAVTTGTSTIIAPPTSFKHHTIIISATSGVNAGALQPETSMSSTDTGTWAPIGGGPVSVIGGGDISFSFEGIFIFIRVRVTTTISGGATPSCTVQYVGNR